MCSQFERRLGRQYRFPPEGGQGSGWTEAIENIGLDRLSGRLGSGLVNFFTNPVILTGGSGGRRRRRCDRVQTVEAGLAFADGVTMAKNLRPLERSMKALQDNVVRSGPVAGASYSLIGALILLGGIGYVIDQWRGTSRGFSWGDWCWAWWSGFTNW